MIHQGEPTMEETIAFFEAIIARLTKEKIFAAQRLSKFITLLDELCANAEHVCDSLEMGQSLKSPKTLADFRRALNDGWAALNQLGEE